MRDVSNETLFDEEGERVERVRQRCRRGVLE